MATNRRQRTASSQEKLGSTLEAKFALIWRILGGPPLEREYRFARPRGWRFDFASPEDLIAFEIEGGAWKVGEDGQRGGRHNRPLGFRDDCEKYNAAGALGWRVFRVTGEMVGVAYLGALLSALRTGGGIDFRLARKGGRAGRFRTTPKGRIPRCNSLRRSGGAPSSSSP
ncbi:MAG TPA: hypothetical protein PLU30_18150 [Verrucomicrobiae bacterium]|nr:hypothetical protein [Verrucomicrobiae bacterium]